MGTQQVTTDVRGLTNYTYVGIGTVTWVYTPHLRGNSIGTDGPDQTRPDQTRPDRQTDTL